MQWIQINAQRDIRETNFSNGDQIYSFKTSGDKHWLPRKTYFRLRCKLSKANGNQLESSDNVSPNLFLPGCLFKKIQFKIGNFVVNEVHSFLPQTYALKKRLTSTKSYLDGFLKQEFSESSFSERQARVCNDTQEDNNTIWYKPGNQASTIAVTAATGVIAGVNTTFTTDLKIGDFIKIDQSVLQIAGITNDTTALARVNPSVNIVASVQWFLKKPTERTQFFEICFQLPLGIFDHNKPLPPGDYSFVLSPENSTSLKRNVIESALANKSPGVDFEFSVESLQLFLCQKESQTKKIESFNFYCDEIICENRELKTTNNLQEENFHVKESTKGLSVVFQDTRAGENTLYSQSLFKISGLKELDIEKLYLVYASQKYPLNEEDIDWIEKSKDYLSQRYYETYNNVGLTFDQVGPESKQDWLEKGPIYHWNIIKREGDKSDRVSVYTKFGSNFQNGSLLLFQHYKKLVSVIFDVNRNEVVRVDQKHVL